MFAECGASELNYSNCTTLNVFWGINNPLVCLESWENSSCYQLDFLLLWSHSVMFPFFHSPFFTLYSCWTSTSASLSGPTTHRGMSVYFFLWEIPANVRLRGRKGCLPDRREDGSAESCHYQSQLAITHVSVFSREAAKLKIAKRDQFIWIQPNGPEHQQQKHQTNALFVIICVIICPNWWITKTRLKLKYFVPDKLWRRIIVFTVLFPASSCILMIYLWVIEAGRPPCHHPNL